VVFGVATQLTPVSGVSLSFGTPVVTGGSLSGLSLPQSFNFGLGGGGGVSTNVTLPPGSTATAAPTTAPSSSTAGASTSPSSSTTVPGSTTQAAKSSASLFSLALTCVLLTITLLFA
jgi:hypothetical protein